MEGFWAVFWLAIVLKIPIVALLWIVWWAIHAEPEVERADEGGGSDRQGHGPRVKPPRPPRRGPHADPVPPAPTRVRANGRSLTVR